MSILRESIAVLRDAFKAWNADRVPRLAAALSFYTMLSLAPTLVLVVAVAGVIVGQQSVRSEIIYQVTTVAGSDVAEMVSSLIDNATQLGAGLVATIASTALIIFGASGAFLQLYDSLNTIWELEPYADRSGIVAILLKRGIAILMVMMIGIALIATLLLNTILSAVTTEIANYLPFTCSLAWPTRSSAWRLSPA